MDLEIEALTSALESLKAISIDSGNKACSFAQSSIISNSSETQSFDNEAEKDMILNGIGELNDFFEEVACSKLRVNANVNALENDGHNESDTTSAEKRYDQEHEQRARTLITLEHYMKSFKTDLIAKELTSTGLWMSNQLIANEDNLAKIEAARAKHPDGVLEGIIGAKDADVANNVRLKVGARHIRGGPQLGAEKPLVSEVRTKFEQFKNDRKQHQAKLLEELLVRVDEMKERNFIQDSTIMSITRQELQKESAELLAQKRVLESRRNMIMFQINELNNHIEKLDTTDLEIQKMTKERYKPVMDGLQTKLNALESENRSIRMNSEKLNQEIEEVIALAASMQEAVANASDCKSILDAAAKKLVDVEEADRKALTKMNMEYEMLVIENQNLKQDETEVLACLKDAQEKEAAALKDMAKIEQKYECDQKEVNHYSRVLPDKLDTIKLKSISLEEKISARNRTISARRKRKGKTGVVVLDENGFDSEKGMKLLQQARQARATELASGIGPEKGEEMRLKMLDEDEDLIKEREALQKLEDMVNEPLLASDTMPQSTAFLSDRVEPKYYNPAGVTNKLMKKGKKTPLKNRQIESAGDGGMEEEYDFEEDPFCPEGDEHLMDIGKPSGRRVVESRPESMYPGYWREDRLLTLAPKNLPQFREHFLQLQHVEDDIHSAIGAGCYSIFASELAHDFRTNDSEDVSIVSKMSRRINSRRNSRLLASIDELEPFEEHAVDTRVLDRTDRVTYEISLNYMLEDSLILMQKMIDSLYFIKCLSSAFYEDIVHEIKYFMEEIKMYTRSHVESKIRQCCFRVLNQLYSVPSRRLAAMRLSGDMAGAETAYPDEISGAYSRSSLRSHSNSTSRPTTGVDVENEMNLTAETASSYINEDNGSSIADGKITSTASFGCENTVVCDVLVNNNDIKMFVEVLHVVYAILGLILHATNTSWDPLIVLIPISTLNTQCKKAAIAEAPSSNGVSAPVDSTDGSDNINADWVFLNEERKDFESIAESVVKLMCGQTSSSEEISAGGRNGAHPEKVNRSYSDENMNAPRLNTLHPGIIAEELSIISINLISLQKKTVENTIRSVEILCASNNAVEPNDENVGSNDANSEERDACDEGDKANDSNAIKANSVLQNTILDALVVLPLNGDYISNSILSMSENIQKFEANDGKLEGVLYSLSLLEVLWEFEVFLWASSYVKPLYTGESTEEELKTLEELKTFGFFQDRREQFQCQPEHFIQEFTADIHENAFLSCEMVKYVYLCGAYILGITSSSLPLNLFLNLKERVLSQWERKRKEKRLEEKRRALQESGIDLSSQEIELDDDDDDDILFHTMEMRDQLDQDATDCAQILYNFIFNLTSPLIYSRVESLLEQVRPQVIPALLSLSLYRKTLQHYIHEKKVMDEETEEAMAAMEASFTRTVESSNSSRSLDSNSDSDTSIELEASTLTFEHNTLSPEPSFSLDEMPHRATMNMNTTSSPDVVVSTNNAAVKPDGDVHVSTVSASGETVVNTVSGDIVSNMPPPDSSTVGKAEVDVNDPQSVEKTDASDKLKIDSAPVSSTETASYPADANLPNCSANLAHVSFEGTKDSGGPNVEADATAPLKPSELQELSSFSSCSGESSASGPQAANNGGDKAPSKNVRKSFLKAVEAFNGVGIANKLRKAAVTPIQEGDDSNEVLGASRTNTPAMRVELNSRGTSGGATRNGESKTIKHEINSDVSEERVPGADIPVIPYYGSALDGDDPPDDIFDVQITDRLPPREDKPQLFDAFVRASGVGEKAKKATTRYELYQQWLDSMVKGVNRKCGDAKSFIIDCADGDHSDDASSNDGGSVLSLGNSRVNSVSHIEGISDRKFSKTSITSARSVIPESLRNIVLNHLNALTQVCNTKKKENKSKIDILIEQFRPYYTELKDSKNKTTEALRALSAPMEEKLEYINAKNKAVLAERDNLRRLVEEAQSRIDKSKADTAMLKDGMETYQALLGSDGELRPGANFELTDELTLALLGNMTDEELFSREYESLTTKIAFLEEAVQAQKEEWDKLLSQEVIMKGTLLAQSLVEKRNESTVPRSRMSNPDGLYAKTGTLNLGEVAIAKRKMNQIPDRTLIPLESSGSAESSGIITPMLSKDSIEESNSADFRFADMDPQFSVSAMPVSNSGSGDKLNMAVLLAKTFGFPEDDADDACLSSAGTSDKRCSQIHGKPNSKPKTPKSRSETNQYYELEQEISNALWIAEVKREAKASISVEISGAGSTSSSYLMSSMSAAYSFHAPPMVSPIAQMTPSASPVPMDTVSTSDAPPGGCDPIDSAPKAHFVEKRKNNPLTHSAPNAHFVEKRKNNPLTHRAPLPIFPQAKFISYTPADSKQSISYTLADSKQSHKGTHGTMIMNKPSVISGFGSDFSAVSRMPRSRKEPYAAVEGVAEADPVSDAFSTSFDIGTLPRQIIDQALLIATQQCIAARYSLSQMKKTTSWIGAANLSAPLHQTSTKYDSILPTVGKKFTVGDVINRNFLHSSQEDSEIRRIGGIDDPGMPSVKSIPAPIPPRCAPIAAETGVVKQVQFNINPVVGSSPVPPTAQDIENELLSPFIPHGSVLIPGVTQKSKSKNSSRSGSPNRETLGKTRSGTAMTDSSSSSKPSSTNSAVLVSTRKLRKIAHTSDIENGNGFTPAPPTSTPVPSVNVMRIHAGEGRKTTKQK